MLPIIMRSLIGPQVAWARRVKKIAIECHVKEVVNLLCLPLTRLSTIINCIQKWLKQRRKVKVTLFTGCILSFVAQYFTINANHIVHEKCAMARTEALQLLITNQ